MHAGVKQKILLYARNKLSIDNWVKMRQYNDSAVIKAKAIKNVLRQPFPDERPRLHAVKAHRKILFITGNFVY